MAPVNNDNEIRSIVVPTSPQMPRIAIPSRLRVSQGVMRPFLRKKVAPEYPAEARSKHLAGTVVLRINIDRTGNVSKVEPVSGDPLFVAAAIEAVQQWKYRPYL